MHGKLAWVAAYASNTAYTNSTSVTCTLRYPLMQAHRPDLCFGACSAHPPPGAMRARVPAPRIAPPAHHERPSAYRDHKQVLHDIWLGSCLLDGTCH